MLDAIRGPIYGHDAYPTLEHKAAALADTIIRRHVFTDGNKRTGTEVLFQMLELNGRTLLAPDDEIVATVEGLAAGEMDFDGLLEWVRRRIR